MNSEETIKACDVSRLWDRDATLWGESAANIESVSGLLGWLDCVEWMEQNMEELGHWARQFNSETNCKEVVLLGMGGSSLAAEVFYQIFGKRSGFPRLHVLDTTSPAEIESIDLNWHETIFIVSSKSGTTVETLDLFQHFYSLLEQNGVVPAQRMIAITDSGSSLCQSANNLGFVRVFENPSNIGGRYSALSYFGLVPAALIGVELEPVLLACQQAKSDFMQASDKNPALLLSRLLFQGLDSGFGMVNLVLSSQCIAFGGWIEQLIAESTGKNGKGILPVIETQGCRNNDNDSDRMSITIKVNGVTDKSSNAEETRLAAESEGGIDFRIQQPGDIGAEFLRWEVATALVSSAMQINPFDQPDVELAKQQSRSFVEQGKTHPVKQVFDCDYFAMFTNNDMPNPGQVVSADSWFQLLYDIGSLRYIGILAFLPRFPDVDERLHQFRQKVQNHCMTTATLGFGPRYLHSTGQLHKGGPHVGAFIQITEEADGGNPIPGRHYSFAQLHRAQADGDYSVLEDTGVPIVRIHLKGDRLAALDNVIQTAA